MKLLIPILFLLASCSASHKIKTSQKKTIDSVATTTVDTSRVVHEERSSSNVQAQDVHIRIDYNRPVTPADSALDKAKDQPADRSKFPARPPRTGNKVVDAIQDAVAAAGNSGNISSVRIDIGSISDSSSQIKRTDSGAGKSTSTTAVHKTDQTSSKEVWRPYMWPVIWILLFLVLVILAYRNRYRLKKIILKLLKL